MGQPRSQTPREPRIPLHVPVAMRPPMTGCWSVNINSIGLGLIARRAASEKAPEEGQEVELSFTLPDGSELSIAGEVRWRHEAPEPSGARVAVSFGVRFGRFAGAGRVVLARWLLGHSFQVVVAFAGFEQRKDFAATLESEATLHFARTPAEVQQLLARGDIAALVLAGEDSGPAEAVLAELGAATETDEADRALPKDLTPRVIYAAPAEPLRLLQLFNSGSIVGALAPPVDLPGLKAAVV
ncbi:MAG: PilZ domain-containing protein, partial [Deltaproteobacteria bacterium]|nr:PilZ domain-containing protein [Deltaproteobacteria bacterium]